VVTAYSTDGRIDAFDLTTLEDDRGSIPPYDAVLLVSARLARERPHAVEALRALVGRLDAAAMRRMNAAVDADGRTAEAVAASAWAALREGDRTTERR
jgi:osmoprotectant transport system permease protein